MSYRTILVPVDQPDGARSAIEAAFLVAQRFSGHVRGLHVLPDLANPATHALVATRMTAEEARDDFRAFRATAAGELDRESSELKRLFDSAAARVGASITETSQAADRPSASWHEVKGFESEAVARLGRVFDLTVVARRGPGGASHETVQAALLETGRPLLLTPPAVPASVGERILLAWNASPQAARAASCALPFLCRAEHVTVMSVGNGPPPTPNAEDLGRSLAWHGIGTEVRHIEQVQRRVRDVLLAEATSMQADLLVVGAYSHSRLRQVVFGGVTEHVLDHAELPVLMAS